MSIPVVKNPSITYKGDGRNKEWEYPYDFSSYDVIKLRKINEDGTETAITNDYTYKPNTKIFIYPVNGKPLTIKEKLLLYRETPIKQAAVLPDLYPYSNIVDTFDYIIMILQEQDILSREGIKRYDELKARFETLEAETNEELEKMKAELLQELINTNANLDAALKALEKRLNQEMADLNVDITKKLDDQEKRLSNQMTANINLINEKLIELEETKQLIYDTRQFLLEELQKTKADVDVALAASQKDTLVKVDEKLDAKTAEMDELIKQGNEIIEATADIDQRLQENHDYVDERIKELSVDQFETRVSTLEVESATHVKKDVYNEDMEIVGKYLEGKVAKTDYENDRYSVAINFQNQEKKITDLRNDALIKSEGGTVTEPITALHFETSEILPKEIRPEINVTRRWVEKYGLEAINEKLLTKEDIGVAQGLVDDLKAISVTTDDKAKAHQDVFSIRNNYGYYPSITGEMNPVDVYHKLKGTEGLRFTPEDSPEGLSPNNSKWSIVQTFCNASTSDFVQMGIANNQEMYYRYVSNGNSKVKNVPWQKVATGSRSLDLIKVLDVNIDSNAPQTVATLPTSWKKLYCRVNGGNFDFMTYTLINKPSCAYTDVLGSSGGYIDVSNNRISVGYLYRATIIIYAEV